MEQKTGNCAKKRNMTGEKKISNRERLKKKRK